MTECPHCGEDHGEDFGIQVVDQTLQRGMTPAQIDAVIGQALSELENLALAPSEEQWLRAAIKRLSVVADKLGGHLRLLPSIARDQHGTTITLTANFMSPGSPAVWMRRMHEQFKQERAN